MERAQREDEENEVISLVIVFIYGVVVMKMSQWLIFRIFCLLQQNTSHSLGKIFKFIWKDHLGLLENAMDYWVSC